MKISNNPNSISIDFEDGQHFDLWQKYSVQDHFTNSKVPVGQRALVGAASPFLLVGALTGCLDSEQTPGAQHNPGTTPADDTGTPTNDNFTIEDNDNDGFPVCFGPQADCSAYFTDNNKTEDCDDTDSGLPYTWYADADGDNYGDPDTTELACEAPTGFVDNALDCDDSSAEIQQGELWYLDVDGDNYGDPNSEALVCDGYTDGLVQDSTDCNDDDASINPGAEETDGLADENCDGYWEGYLTASSSSDQVLSVLDGAAGHRLGMAIEGGVDYTGDGIVDTVIGAPATSSNDTTTWVAIAPGTGNSSGWDVSGRVELQGEAGDRAGYALAHAGDVNGDGYADLIVGAPYANDQDGEAYLLMGPIESGSFSSADLMFRGDGDQLGTNVDSLEISGTTYLLTDGDTNSGNGYSGSLKVWDQNGSSVATVTSADSNDFGYFGVHTASADLDGDGVSELLISARNEGSLAARHPDDPAVPGREGQVYICQTAGLHGVVDTATLGCSVLTGEAAPHNLGTLVYADGSDLDGDGYSDWVLGAAYHDALGSETGAYYVGSGMPVDGVVTNSSNATFLGDGENSFTGEQAAIADANGDGNGTLYLGSYGVNMGRGAIYQVDPTVSGVFNLADSNFVIYGESETDEAGVIANTGDVNGDGADNLVIGAISSEYNGFDAGSAYLLGF